MKLKKLFSLQSGLTRMQYFVFGTVLAGIKYNLDRLTAFSFGKQWYFYDYYYNIEAYLSNGFPPQDADFFMTMLLTALPFIYVGTIFTLKRLLDSGLPAWLVCFFFIPYVNLLMFSILCSVPSDNAGREPDSAPSFLYRFIPKSIHGSAIMAVAVSVFFSGILSLVSIEYFTEYGWGLFIGIPFFSGFSSVLIAAYHQPLSFAKSMALSVLTIVVFSAALLILAMEGLICLVMAAPIGIVLAMLGGMAGYSIQKRYHTPLSSAGNLLLVIPLLMFAEKNIESKKSDFSVETSIEVKADPELVWNELVSFGTIAPPDELIFKMGIAYPTHASINGTGKGAVRECVFTTGSFIEPITVWDKPSRLAFDVLQQPVPMTELSFYKNLQTPHLHGYFQSQRGEFKLEKLSNGNTLLMGTTWYQNNLWPGFYWKIWSDVILHQIHYRVLNHIKVETEKNVK